MQYAGLPGAEVQVMSGYWKHLGEGSDAFIESIADEQSNNARSADKELLAAANSEREKMKSLGWRECETRHECSACGEKTAKWWRRVSAPVALAAILPKRRVVVYACVGCTSDAIEAEQAKDIESLRRELPKTLAGALSGDAAAIKKLRGKYPTES